MVAGSVGYFWTLQHAQLYTEPERLAEAGYVTETREETGRRRKLYSLTAKGRAALDEWRSEPTSELAELREPALLKLFFGADPSASPRCRSTPTARGWPSTRRSATRCRTTSPSGPRTALEIGIRVEQATIAFWEEQAG